MTKTITAIFGIAVMTAVLFGGMTFSQSAYAGVDPGNNGQNKVPICHVDQDTGEKKTITIGESAVSAHVGSHEGDHLGECVEVEPDCSVSPNPLEMIFDLSEPQLATTSVGCTNDQPNDLGAHPIDTNCLDVRIGISEPNPFQSFITPESYGVDFEFLVEPFIFIPDESVECSIIWATDSVNNGVELHEQTVIIHFPLPPPPP